MAIQLQLRRGTTTANNTFTGAEGELTVDITTDMLRLHDGSKLGGWTIPSLDYVKSLINAVIPVGLIAPYGGTTAPSGWLLCNGNAVSRTTYSALFNKIGTAYGAGDGSTTFNLPNGKIPLGLTAPVAISGNNDSAFQSLLVKRASDDKTHPLWFQTPYGVYATNNIETDGATYTSGGYKYTFNSLYTDLTQATAVSNAIIKY